MTIYKLPQHLEFYTHAPNEYRRAVYVDDDLLTPLHHTHDTTDWQFLLKHFPPEHPIFTDFGTSYFFKVHKPDQQ